MNSLFEQSNKVYPRQVAVLTFLASITYKIVMLPKYLAMGAPRDFVMGVAVAMLIEAIAFGVVFMLISGKCSLVDGNILYRAMLALIVTSCAIKFVVLSVETLDYISSMLFQEGRWLFIILTLMPALGYIVYKGINTIARVGEIVLWAVIVTFLFALVFLKANVDLGNILPMFDSGVGDTASTLFKHSIWFGDAVPFLVLEVAQPRTRLDKCAIPIGIGVTYVMTVGFYLLFIAIYGEVAPYIKYAFSNIGIYNSISNVLGGADFPIVCVWLLMAIVKLSLLLYGVTHGIDGILGGKASNRRRVIVIIVAVITAMLVLSFAVSSASKVHDFAVGAVHIVVLVMDALAILVALIIRLIVHRRMRHEYNK